MLEPQAKSVIIGGRYRLQRRLRRGGMSEVFLAYDEYALREVAIKLVSGDDPDCIQRLQREAKTTNALLHPHILPTLDHGEHDGYYYLVMPYMRQGTLRERLANGPLSLQEAGSFLEQIADALQFAHERGIIHRDIKPSNMLLGDDQQRVYLADFGLAKSLGAGSDITQTGCLIGTPEYMAPELAEQPESASSDIYALGILLYQMLAGRVPFKGSTPLSIYWKHLREHPLPPSRLNPAIPLVIEQIILRALAKDPQQRFQTPRELAQAYTQALAAQSTAVNLARMATQSTLGTINRPLQPQTLAPAQVVLKKAGEITQPPARYTTPLWKKPRSRLQTGLVACMALLILLVAPMSLGFLLSREGTVPPTILGTSSNFVDKSLPAHSLAPTATPTSSSTQPGSTGGTNSHTPHPQPSPRPHKHGHGHGHGRGHGGEGD